MSPSEFIDAMPPGTTAVDIRMIDGKATTDYVIIGWRGVAAFTGKSEAWCKHDRDLAETVRRDARGGVWIWRTDLRAWLEKRGMR